MSFWKRLFSRQPRQSQNENDGLDAILQLDRDPHTPPNINNNINFCEMIPKFSGARSLWDAAHAMRTEIHFAWKAKHGTKPSREQEHRIEEKADKLLQSGNRHSNEGRSEEAIRDYEQTILMDPNAGGGYISLLAHLEKTKRYETMACVALAGILTCACCIEGDDLGVDIFRALLIALKELEGENRVNLLIQLAELQSDSAALRWCAGHVYDDHKRTLDALNQFELALAIDPNFFLAMYDSGRMNHILGNYQKALNCYNAAIKCAPADAMGIRLNSKAEHFATQVKEKLETPFQSETANIDSLIAELEKGKRTNDNEAYQQIKAIGGPAVEQLLDVALDDQRKWSTRQAAISLLGEIGDQCATEPLFNRFVRGIDPRVISRTDDIAFGLYRTTLDALKSLGFKLQPKRD